MKSIIRFLVFLFIVILCVASLYFWRRAEVYASQMASQPPSSSMVVPVATIPPSSAAPASLSALDEETTSLIAGIIPSVVSIQATSDQRQARTRRPSYFGGEDSGGAGQVGSGVIVSKDGYIITNLHVVQGGDSIDVILHDGRRLPATLAGSYAPADIAILKINADDLQPIRIGDSERVKVGQTVFAIGNPYGLQESVSHGIISAKGRRSPDETNINEFFQTTATLNPGSSGGPVINISGELVGISNFIFSQSGGWQGIGFVIPSNNARRIFEDIVTRGRVVSPYLGAGSQWRKIPAAVRTQMELPDGNGMLVTMVQKGSPAEEAGIKTGDFIRKYNGKTVVDATDLRNRVLETTPGQKVTLEIFREGRALQLDVLIREQPYKANLSYFPVRPPGQRTAVDGIVVYDDPTDKVPGVWIAGFQNASPAARYLRPGDLILQIGNQSMPSLEALRALADKLPPNVPQQVLVQRNNLEGWVQIDPR